MVTIPSHIISVLLHDCHIQQRLAKMNGRVEDATKDNVRVSYNLPVTFILPKSSVNKVDAVKQWYAVTQSDFVQDFNPDEHRIETPFQDLLTNEKWEFYRRAVAEQIAIKLANVENLSSSEVGRYAVETATMVVKQLREITI